jgi:cell division protein FtsQ
MAKSKKMAIRKTQEKSREFEFAMPRVGKAVLRSLLVSVLISGIALLAYQSAGHWKKLWPVKAVLLQGETQYLLSADIVNFVNNQAVKGMLAIDLEELQTAASKIDWVQSVEVRKVWPDQLVFVVNEHLPVARIDGFILTAEGTKIPQGTRAELFNDLPEISLSSGQEIKVQAYIDAWHEFKQIKRQLELLSLVPSSLRVDEVHNWHLGFSEGLEMNLGRKQRAERVARLVQVYQAIADKERIKSIDLRYHNGVSIEWINQPEAELKG